MTRWQNTAEFRGAEFVDADMSGARFREVDLSGVRMDGVLLIGGDIDGVIEGLRVNGVEVAPLVEAELDRLHPERVKLRATTPEGMREAWAVVEPFWGETMDRARVLPEAELQWSVDDEWSFVQTLRHLVYVTDAWLGHAVQGLERPFHRLGLPASFDTGADSYGVDVAARPTFEEVAEVRAGRMAQVREFVSRLAGDDLDRTRGPNHAPGYPEPEGRTAADCLRVILNDEWAHHQFAVRDLATLGR